MDSTSWKDFSKIDPELEALLPHLPPFQPLADHKDVHHLRHSMISGSEYLISAGLIKAPDLTGISKEEIRVPTRDGLSIRAVHYRPTSNTPGPLLVYFFGGGWTFGWPESKESWFEILVKELGFVVVGVDYRLSPEYVFPKAAEDGWDALKWTAENAPTLGADPSKGLIVWGTSAGGNLAAVASHMAVDAKLSPPVTGVFLEVPVLVHPEAVPEKYKPHYNSYEDNKAPVFLPREDLTYIYNSYKPDPSSPLMSPLLWPGGHKGQPPTYLMLCGQDPLRDEGLIYEHCLREDCGVPTRLDLYPGLPHSAPDIFPNLSIHRRSQRDMKAGLEWLLSHSIC
ncbi:Alpha/Beta hydrolase protein [Aspergillus keveii]|uniref:Alpha/Beta hydrolase protein n=1 Tax=Aspergillus keveii TaxID=714993 RepID=A0ABR4FKR4_9EURO